MLVRTVACLEGEVEIELVCEPAFDYGRIPAEWTLVEGSRHIADATGAGQTIRLQTDLELGIEANRVRPGTPSSRARGLRALSWEEDLRGARRRRRGQRAARRHRPVLATLARAGAPVRRPPLARVRSSARR